MPSGIVVDKDKNVFVAYTDINKIKKITANGTEQDFAGTSDPGYLDGPASEAQFFNPEGLVLVESTSGEHTFFVVDRQNKKIRKVVFEE